MEQVNELLLRNQLLLWLVVPLLTLWLSRIHDRLREQVRQQMETRHSHNQTLANLAKRMATLEHKALKAAVPVRAATILGEPIKVKVDAMLRQEKHGPHGLEQD